MSFKRKLDKYEVVACYIPSIISIIPLSHFIIIVFSKSFLESISNSVSYMLVADLTISTVLGVAVVHIQTWFSKAFVEEVVFGKGGINFPTTNILLFSKGLYSKARKIELRALIKKEFNIVLPNEKKELENVEEAQMQCREIVSQIRKKVANQGMVRSYNIRYGLLRNLIGGVIWLPGSLASAIYYGFNNQIKIMLFFSVWAALSLLIFFLKKIILEKAAFSYADSLYTEFLSSK